MSRKEHECSFRSSHGLQPFNSKIKPKNVADSKADQATSLLRILRKPSRDIFKDFAA